MKTETGGRAEALPVKNSRRNFYEPEIPFFIEALALIA
jgi:hypothetical protein